jgi:hypothetical protein
MSKQTSTRLAWSLCGLTIFLILCATTLAVLNRYNFGDASFLVAEASAAVVGGLISARQPRNLAALFSPLRRRVQIFVDSRFYRSKYDARKTLEEFGTKLRDETNLEQLNAELLSVVSTTVQPAHASLWLRPADREVVR